MILVFLILFLDAQLKDSSCESVIQYTMSIAHPEEIYCNKWMYIFPTTIFQDIYEISSSLTLDHH